MAALCQVISPFLSTLSLRRATRVVDGSKSSIEDFYPRSPCGERLSMAALCQVISPFLSTLSLRRATADCPSITVLHCNFYPRSPCGERHLGAWKSCNVCRISIHALLAESDKRYFAYYIGRLLFLSTLSLRRATARNTSIAGRITSFLSTLSLRRATWLRCWQLAARDISIHALLAESDT